jgi:hypothetical protein
MASSADFSRVAAAASAGDAGAAGEVPDSAVDEEVVGGGRGRDFEEFLPTAESSERETGEVPQEWGFDGLARAAIVVEREVGGLLGCFQRSPTAAFEELSPPQEMEVVGVVCARKETRRAELPDVCPIGPDGGFVGGDLFRQGPKSRVQGDLRIDATQRTKGADSAAAVTAGIGETSAEKILADSVCRGPKVAGFVLDAT